MMWYFVADFWDTGYLFLRYRFRLRGYGLMFLGIPVIDMGVTVKVHGNVSIYLINDRKNAILLHKYTFKCIGLTELLADDFRIQRRQNFSILRVWWYPWRLLRTFKPKWSNCISLYHFSISPNGGLKNIFKLFGRDVLRKYIGVGRPFKSVSCLYHLFSYYVLTLLINDLS